MARQAQLRWHRLQLPAKRPAHSCVREPRCDFKGHRYKRAMQCLGIHHVSLLVDAMEPAVAFYREVLGLREIPRPSSFGGDPRLAVRWFELGQQQLHLMPATANDGHVRRHFCIQIEDAAAARSACEARGLEIQEEVEIPGIVRFFIFDPCGNRIELAQWL